MAGALQSLSREAENNCPPKLHKKPPFAITIFMAS